MAALGAVGDAPRDRLRQSVVATQRFGVSTNDADVGLQRPRDRLRQSLIASQRFGVSTNDADVGLQRARDRLRQSVVGTQRFGVSTNDTDVGLQRPRFALTPLRVARARPRVTLRHFVSLERDLAPSRRDFVSPEREPAPNMERLAGLVDGQDSFWQELGDSQVAIHPAGTLRVTSVLA
jgi:hypothetical protein